VSRGRWVTTSHDSHKGAVLSPRNPPVSGKKHSMESPWCDEFTTEIYADPLSSYRSSGPSRAHTSPFLKTQGVILSRPSRSFLNNIKVDQMKWQFDLSEKCCNFLGSWKLMAALLKFQFVYIPDLFSAATCHLALGVWGKFILIFTFDMFTSILFCSFLCHTTLLQFLYTLSLINMTSEVQQGQLACWCIFYFLQQLLLLQ